MQYLHSKDIKAASFDLPIGTAIARWEAIFYGLPGMSTVKPLGYDFQETMLL